MDSIYQQSAAMTARAKQGYPVSSGVTKATEAMERIMGGYLPGASSSPATLPQPLLAAKGGVPLLRATTAPSKADRIQADMRALYSANWVHGEQAHVQHKLETVAKDATVDRRSPASAYKHTAGGSTSDASSDLVAAANAAAIGKLESEVYDIKEDLRGHVQNSAPVRQHGASAHEKLDIRHAAVAGAQKVPIKITANKLSSSESSAAHAVTPAAQQAHPAEAAVKATSRSPHATAPTLHAATSQITETAKEHASSARKTHDAHTAVKQPANTNSRAHVSESPRVSSGASPLFAAFTSTAQHAARILRQVVDILKSQRYQQFI